MNGIRGMFPRNFIHIKPASGELPSSPNPTPTPMEAPIDALGVPPSRGGWSFRCNYCTLIRDNMQFDMWMLAGHMNQNISHLCSNLVYYAGMFT